MYQTLKGLGAFIEVSGWLVCGGSFLFLLYGFITAADSRQPAAVVFISLVPTLIGVVSGILIAIYGQVILCFTGIEENTRKTFVALEDLASRTVDDDKKGNAHKVLLAGLQLREPEVEAKVSASRQTPALPLWAWLRFKPPVRTAGRRSLAPCEDSVARSAVPRCREPTATRCQHTDHTGISVCSIAKAAISNIRPERTFADSAVERWANWSKP
jgi:hypothetical protein